MLFADIKKHGTDIWICDRELLAEQPGCSVQTFAARWYFCNFFIDQFIDPAAQFLFFFVIKLVNDPVEHQAATVGAASINQQFRINTVQQIRAFRSIACLTDEC